MKIGGVSSGAGVTAASGPRRAPAEGFAPSAGTVRGAVATAPGAAVSSVAGLEALLMLQEEGGPAERKRRAVRRAGHVLDKLDAVKLALLNGGQDVSAMVDDLRHTLREQRGVTEDAGLEQVLDEIETRAAVELAKAEVQRRA